MAADCTLDPLLREAFAEPLLTDLAGRVRAGERPLIGLNGPVGAGKTTLCRWLGGAAGRHGLRLAVASIDDFYLPWAERQQRLAGNPFGVSRVPPGSHDTNLLLTSLRHWRGGDPLLLPRFDKTLRGGQGDRSGLETLDADALVLEGWLVGCQPLGADRLAEDPELTRDLKLTVEEQAWLPHWDRALRAYGPVWDQLSDLALLRPDDWTWPRRWRFQAEARQRGAGGDWLSGPELERLVRSSLNSLPPSLYQQPLEAVATRVAWLDGRRRCVRVQG
jgi:D-glycerate 3-kinase